MMRNNSMPIFSLDSAPLLSVEDRSCGPCLKLRDSQDPIFSQGVDFYTPNEDLSRLQRAADAFNAVMREPIENREAAE
jgi:hypothetical protein